MLYKLREPIPIDTPSLISDVEMVSEIIPKCLYCQRISRNQFERECPHLKVLLSRTGSYP